MGVKRWYGRFVVVAVAVLAFGLLVRAGHSGDTPKPLALATPSASQPTTAGPSASGQGAGYDPARFAAPVRTHAGTAGIDPQLLMAILYNESYKPHDPELERSWQRLKPDSAFGIANMHRAAFEETRQGRDFAGRKWEELPDDPDLAVEAAAWYLHDLAAQLPSHWSGAYTRDDLLALGYNAGPGNMLAFARGATPGADAHSYLDRLHENWSKAGKAMGQ